MVALGVVRLAACWLLFGAALKAFTGTPRDLPAAILGLPWGDLLTFRLAIGIEAVVGILALFAPRRGWLPLALVYMAFIVVLWPQRAAESCGCMGKLVLPPVLMLAIDAAWLVLLVCVMPWRLPRESVRRVAIALGVGLLLALVPWLHDRRASTPGRSGFLVLDVASWPGKRVKDLPIVPWVPAAARLENGAIVVWRASCAICASHLDALAGDQDFAMGDRSLLLVQLPNEDSSHDEAGEVHVMPEGYWVEHVILDGSADWLVTPPLHVEVVQGVVASVRDGVALAAEQR